MTPDEARKHLMNPKTDDSIADEARSVLANEREQSAAAQAAQRESEKQAERAVEDAAAEAAAIAAEEAARATVGKGSRR